jgi:3-amino-5-hydroxybenzoate synthase
MMKPKQRKTKPNWPYYSIGDLFSLYKVLASRTWWRNDGTQVKLLEKEFAEYQEANYAISVANGTQALEIALKSLDIQKGDEVILPAFTFFSTLSCVLKCEATPVLVDVEKDTCCIDPQKVADAITDKTKAIIVVHMAGQSINMDEMIAIAQKNNLKIIEDAAHAHGAEWKGKKVGALHYCGAFSFQNAKLMTAGEGGMITTNSQDVYERCILLSNCGRRDDERGYNHTEIGTNSRLSEFQGAILRNQLKRLDKQLAIRAKNYRYLSKLLSEIKGITLLKEASGATLHSRYMTIFYYDKTHFNNLERNDFVRLLKENEISANISYDVLSNLPIYKKLNLEKRFPCSNSAEIARNCVCLNHSILLRDKRYLNKIAKVIKDLQGCG